MAKPNEKRGVYCYECGSFVPDDTNPVRYASTDGSHCEHCGMPPRWGAVEGPVPRSVSEALAEVMPDPDGSPRVLTAWVAVAEFADADGFRQISFASSDGLPSWLAKGMLLEPILSGPD